jgi:hypothetical protein
MIAGRVVALVVAFVILSLVADRNASEQRVITATVVEWRAGESITFANDHNGHDSIEISLRDTVYEGDTANFGSGVRVTVWYRYLGERRPVADTVRVLDATGR